MGSTVQITAHDGGTFGAYLATPAQGSGPGVVVIQEIFGVNEYVRRTADRLAEEGYVVLAPDLFWRIEPGIDLGYSPEEWQRAFELFGLFDVDKGVEDIGATIDTLRALPQQAGRVGCVGYCLGGKLAFLTAARNDVDCAVSYYGVGMDAHGDEAAKVTVPLVFHMAELDQYAPAESRDTLQAAFVGNDNATFHLYPGADHAFAREEGDHYDKPAALMAYGRTMETFRRVLGPVYDLSSLWDAHCFHEFATRNVPDTMATMVAEPYVNHIPTMTGGVGAKQLSALLPVAFRRREPRGHQAHPHLPHRRRHVARRRDAVLFHPHPRDRLDAPRRAADRPLRRDPPGGDRELPGRQALPRAHLLGSGVGPRPDRCARPRRPARRRGGDGAQAHRRDAPVERTDGRMGHLGRESALKLDGAVVLVTGAGGGIGQAALAAFADAGAAKSTPPPGSRAPRWACAPSASCPFTST